MSVLGIVLLVILILLLFGALGNGANWGYAPGGLLGLVLIIVLILVLLGHI